MPVTYSIDSTNRTIRTTLTGRMTGADVSGHFDALFADPAITGDWYVLLDATALAATISIDLIRATAAQISRVRGKLGFPAVAVIVSGAAQYGMFRMGQVMLESHLGPTYIFRDAAQAEAWLAQARAERT